MTWWPRSLFGRNALLIVALMIIGQLVSGVLVRELIVKPRFELFGEGLARNISAIRTGLMALPAAERSHFVEQFNQRALANLPPEPTRGAAMRALLTPIERRLVSSVSARVAAEGAAVVWRREAGGSLAVRITLDGSEHWIVLPGVLPAREFSGAWFAASFSSVLLALLGALLIQRHLHQPLREVVKAAHALASGATPPTLAEDGPTEVATLAHSFNQMAASLGAAERERALMLAGISHDLRTPLTKLRLGVEILRDQSEPALVASMTRSVEEMDTIVGQFLDYARGDGDAAPQPIALDALAREVASACTDHGQPLVLDLAATPSLPLRAEPLRRALVNLVENAFRHGRGPVTLRTGSDVMSVWVEVADQGDGISAAEAALLRQPFQRAQAARNGPPGAGLGLAIVERVARAHDGTLQLLPNEPHGLRARLTLPRR
ncbi:MAG: ATP-binding protein [Burkholderiales bacterium]